MKKDIRTILLASSLSFFGCSHSTPAESSSFLETDSKEALSHVEKINSEQAYKYTKTVSIITREMVNGVLSDVETPCNISKVEIEKIPYYTSAKHCFEGYTHQFQGKDIILIKSFQENFKAYGLVYDSYRLGGNNINLSFPLSEKNINTLGKEPLKIIGCLKHASEKNTDVCYAITSPAIKGNIGKVEMHITSADQKKILQEAGRPHTTNMKGISGAPVFDTNNKLFGVLIENTHINNEKKIMTIKIQPIRDENGKIMTGKIDN